jgi:hypothetical protein
VLTTGISEMEVAAVDAAFTDVIRLFGVDAVVGVGGASAEPARDTDTR